MTKAESLGNLILAAGLEPGSFWLVLDETSATITYAEGTAQSLKDAAQAVINVFDFSDAAQLLRNNAGLRVQAKAAIAGDQTFGTRLTVAIDLTALDAINVLRAWITTFKAEVAAATSLANLQTRVANNTPNLPQIGIAAVIQAVKDKLDSGAADAS